jgi:hypothetical protein
VKVNQARLVICTDSAFRGRVVDYSETTLLTTVLLRVAKVVISGQTVTLPKSKD